MNFRDAIQADSPPFLDETGNAGAFQFTEGAGIDILTDWAIDGVKASMPGIGTNTALPYIGRDMVLEQGPNETDNHFIARLRNSIDTHKRQGSAAELLRALAAYFSPSTAYPIRLVNDRAVWHEYNYGTDVITKTNVGSNWNWDGTVKPWRGWVIIDVSSSGFTGFTYGSGAKYGDGHVYGFVPRQLALDVRHVISTWKPAKAQVMVIFCNLSTILRRTDTSPPNPNGDWNLPANRDTNANYLGVP